MRMDQENYAEGLYIKERLILTIIHLDSGELIQRLVRYRVFEFKLVL